MSVGLLAAWGAAVAGGAVAPVVAAGAGAGGLAQAAIRPTKEPPPARLAAACRKRRRLTGSATEVVRTGSDMHSTSARTYPVLEWRAGAAGLPTRHLTPSGSL